MLSLEDTSPKELLKKVHSKSQHKSILLLPTVYQKMKEQETGHRTQNSVSFLDLEHVLKSGSVIKLEAASEGWELTLQGVTLNGEVILVSLYLSRKDNDPLQIRSFGLVQQSFIDLVGSLSNEEQITTQEFIRHLRQNTPIAEVSFQAVLDSFIREHRELLQKLAH